jgi:hypothetical protein
LEIFVALVWGMIPVHTFRPSFLWTLTTTGFLLTLGLMGCSEEVVGGPQDVLSVDELDGDWIGTRQGPNDSETGWEDVGIELVVSAADAESVFTFVSPYEPEWRSELRCVISVPYPAFVRMTECGRIDYATEDGPDLANLVSEDESSFNFVQTDGSWLYLEGFILEQL